MKIVLATTVLVFALASCNQIKEEKRVLVKNANQSLLVMNIPSAGCENCQRVMENGLKNVMGVKQSILNLNTKKVSVIYDPNLATAGSISKSVIELSDKIPCK